MSTTAVEWLQAFAERLGIDAPSDQERNDLLALAGTAAHASERTAAPVACWMVARAGITPTEAMDIAKSVVTPSSGE